MIFHEAQELWRSLKKVHSYILWGLTLNSYHRLWGGRGEEWKHSKLSEKPFFPSWESRAHWKVFERFYDFCTLHIVAQCAGQPSPQANQMHKTNKQQILAEFLRCAHVYKHQDQLRQNVWYVTTSPPLPHFTCHATVSSTKDIKRVNKNIRRLLAVTGPCSWMRHNFSQFPR